MRRRSRTPCFTHGNLHLCINDATNLPDAPSPTSHQFWLHTASGLCLSRTHFVYMGFGANNLRRSRYLFGFRLKTSLKIAGTLSVTQEFGDGFGPRPYLQFFVNPADIGVDGFVADFELVGNFLVHQSLAQQIEHLLFALG